MRRILTVAALALCISACQKGPATDGPGKETTAAPRTASAGLQDIIERKPQYLVGITFPPVANRHPPLAKALQAYADQSRAQLAKAVEEAGSGGRANLPYDLSLNFTDVSQREDAIVIAADGSLYTGGAHGTPLIARFTYLPSEQRLLQASDLVGEDGWKAVSDYVREQLSDAIEKRLDEDEIPEAERPEILESASAMIEEGTLPDAANFSHFEPIPSADGKWFGLRFVFPPYQVGPYSDGTQTVEVPVEVLRPFLKEPYRARFTGG